MDPWRSRLGAALITALVCAGWAPPRAAADPDQPAEGSERIGVLEVATYGVSQAAGDKFEQSVEETLAGVGYRVVRSQTVHQQLAGSNYIAGCTFGPCLREVLRRTGLRRVLVARIQGAGQSYSVITSLVDTDTGRLLSQVAQSCPVCTVEEAISTSTLAVVELLTRSDAQEALAAPAARGPAPAERAAEARLAVRRAQAGRLGWIFAAGGVAALGLGGALVLADQTRAGAVSIGAGGGLAAAGLTALVWSKSF